MSDKSVAASAVAGEAAGSKYVLTIGDDFSAEIPRKFKRFKFMRAMASGDLWLALQAVWPDTEDADGDKVPNPVLVELENLDVDDDEMATAIEALGNTLIGSTAKNSKSSLPS